MAGNNKITSRTTAVSVARDKLEVTPLIKFAKSAVANPANNELASNVTSDGAIDRLVA